MKRDGVCAYVHKTYDTPLPQYAPVHILDDPPPIPPPSSFLQLHTYLMDDIFLNQKINKNIQILYSLKYKHSNIF